MDKSMQSKAGPGHGRLIACWGALLLALGAGAPITQSHAQLNLETCSGATIPISAVVGTDPNAQVSVTGQADTQVQWQYSAIPPFPPCSEVAADRTFLCYGVTIDLPADALTDVAATEPVTLTDAPTEAGAVSFALEVRNSPLSGTSPCAAPVELVITAPTDIVFVLDRSGSMRSTVNVNPPATDRWDALSRAVDQFLDTSAYLGCSGNRFGVKLFANTALPNATFPEPLQPVATMPDPMNELQHPTHNPPSGSTAMGQGLQEGIAKLTDNQRNRVVMLFTDGEQNQPPEVDPMGLTYQGGATIAPGGPGPFRIVTIGIGNPDVLYQSTLQNLATNHDGPYLVTATGTDISGAMDNALMDLFSGCSPQMVTRGSGSAAAGEPTQVTSFDVNQKVDRLLIKLSFDRRMHLENPINQLGVRITKGDTEDVTGFFETVASGDDYLLLGTDFVEPHATSGALTLAPEGRYSVSMTAPGNGVGYRVVVFADDHRLDMDLGIEPKRARVNEPLDLSLSLTWYGAPVTTADAQALILTPADLGHLLATNPQTVDPSSQPDAGSPGYQKYLHLLENDPDFLASLVPVEQTIALSHQGDGRYVGSFDPGINAGVYQVVFGVTAEDPGFGMVQRTATRSVHVRPGDVDLEASGVTTSVTGESFLISFRPVTTYGRYLGPANAKAFSVNGQDIQLNKVTDHQDGSYTISLSGNPQTEISLDFLGDPIYRGRAIDIDKPQGPDGLPWWLWILILLAVLLVIWLVVRKLGGGSGP